VPRTTSSGQCGTSCKYFADPALELTTRVVHESLRLCPPAAVVARLAMRDVMVDGWRVPAGSNVVVGIMALHTDPALWPDPQRFDPDRFLPEHSRGRDRWQYLPFGAGPRSCIGDHFAMLEATLGWPPSSGRCGSSPSSHGSRWPCPSR
jgi:cytochrome P450